jgi:hypothetical protein
MSNFQNYLIAKGRLNASKSEKEELFKAYRKEYFKNYNKDRKSHSKLVQLWFKTPEYSVLSEDAEKLGIKITELIRKVLKVYKEQSFVLPDEEVLHDLIVSLTRIGTNLNQISYLCNSQKKVGYKEIEEVKILFNKIEQTTLNHFRPLHLENYVRNQAKRNPMFISHLERIIQDYKDLKL